MGSRAHYKVEGYLKIRRKVLRAESVKESNDLESSSLCAVFSQPQLKESEFSNWSQRFWLIKYKRNWLQNTLIHEQVPS